MGQSVENISTDCNQDTLSNIQYNMREIRSRASSVSPISSTSSSPQSVSPTFDQRHHHQYLPARKPYRMASSFELSSDQPNVAIYHQRAKKLSANSYQNLFGEPAERARPLAKKVSKTIPPEPRSRKPKPLPVDPLTGEVIGHRDLVAALFAKQELSAPAPVKTKRSPGGNHSQLW